MSLRIAKTARCVGTIAAVLCLCSATSWATFTVSFDSVVVPAGTASVTRNVLISTTDVADELSSASINVIATGPKPIFLDAWSPTPTGNVWIGATSLSTVELVPVDGTKSFSKLNTTIDVPANLTVAASGALMSVTFDTSAGVFGDVFEVALNTTLAGFSTISADGDPYPLDFVTYVPGTITVGIPEPSSFLMIGLIGGLGVALQSWRKLRSVA